MTKRPASGPIEEMTESQQQAPGRSGGAMVGGTAVATKTGTTDGTIDFTPNFSDTGVHHMTFTFTGRTWLNNINPTTSAPDANLWANFAWEYPNLWIDDVLQSNLLSRYLAFKPESVTVKFGDAFNYTVINTGTTPIMIPSGNQKIYGMLDLEYILPVTSNPWKWGAFSGGNPGIVPTLIPNAFVTTANAQNLMRSFQNGGYTPGVGTDNQNFLLNTYTFDPAVTNNSKYLGTNSPHTKTIKMGSGHSMSFTHHFSNKYWRNIQLIGWNSADIEGLAGGAANNWMAPRADENVGLIRNWTFSGAAGAGNAYARLFENGAVPAVGTGQAIDSSTQIVAGATQTASSYFPAANTLQAGVSQINCVYCSPEDPQPHLLLHLEPDIGVLGTVGTSQVLLDFEISWTIAMRGQALPRGRTVFANNPIAVPPVRTVNNWFHPIAIGLA